MGQMSQGLLDTGKQKLAPISDTNVVFQDLGSTEDLILEENRQGEGISSSEISWKKRFVAFLSVLLLSAIFLGMVFVAWPKKPEITLTSFEFDESTPTTPGPDGQLLSNWIAKVSVKSPNYFDVGIKTLRVNAYIPSNQKTPVGFGQAEDIVIEKQKNTLITMNFKVPVYQPSSGNPSLIEECMNNGKATLLIKAEVDLNLLHWTGKVVRTSMTKEIDCSLPQLYSLARSHITKPKS